MSTFRLSSLINNFSNLRRISNNLNNLKICAAHKPQARHYATEENSIQNETGKTEEMSKAMRAYLQRAKEHDEFMERERHEYRVGKRHLANMMGEDPETFTDDDVDRSIQYLFPSGIFDPKARPIMKPPEQIFPQRKAAEFDAAGRPFHSLFYTIRPNFYQLLYDIAEHSIQLHRFQDQMIKKGQKPDPNLELDSTGCIWLEKEALENIILEKLIDKEYNNFITAMERLVAEPYSYRIKDFIEKYRKPLLSQTKTHEVPKVKYDQDGRAYITTYECLRKRARGDVTIRSPGTGKITINGEDITYFKDTQPREQLLFPLIFTGMHNTVDIEANVEGGGPSGQAGAIRWGIAWGLRSFVDKEMLEKMRLAGLLTRDYRKKERKKPGQEGARRKFTWKKR